MSSPTHSRAFRPGELVYVYWDSDPIPRPGAYVKLTGGGELARVETANGSSGDIEKRKLTVKIVTRAQALAAGWADPEDGRR